MTISRKNIFYKIAYGDSFKAIFGGKEAGNFVDFIGDVIHGLVFYFLYFLVFISVLLSGYYLSINKRKITPLFFKKQKWYYFPAVYGSIFSFVALKTIYLHGVWDGSNKNVYYNTHQVDKLIVALFVFALIVSFALLVGIYADGLTFNKKETRKNNLEFKD